MKKNMMLAMLAMVISGISWSYGDEEAQVNTVNIPLQLFLSDQSHLIYPMAQPQLTITPNISSYTFNQIRIISFNSTNGSCGSGQTANTLIDSTDFPNVTLSSGTSYTSTDSSNFALRQLNPNHTFTTDMRYILICFGCGGTVAQTCLSGFPSGVCSAPDNCGWGAPQTWNP